ncbi:MAG: hypothetical protein R2734_19910 [Nocardioides sp.]
MLHAKPTYYANRGSLSLVAREIRMVGLGSCWRAWSAASSCWQPRASSRPS